MNRQVGGWGKNPAKASNDQESRAMTTYDPNNIFARILRGELPSHRVFENEHCLAFMDIMPRSPGHTLVIPRSPARTILDIEPAALSALAMTVQTVARAVKTAMVADGLTIQQFNESAGGQVVFHLHFHIIPRWEGKMMAPHGAGMAPAEQLMLHAEQIKAVLAG
jgi:histidine triad (HIT) family protein